MSSCRVLYVIGGVSYVEMLLNTREYLDPMTSTWNSAFKRFEEGGYLGKAPAGE